MTNINLSTLGQTENYKREACCASNRLSLIVICYRRRFGFNCFRVYLSLSLSLASHHGTLCLHRNVSFALNTHAHTHIFPSKGSCPEDNTWLSKYNFLSVCIHAIYDTARNMNLLGKYVGRVATSKHLSQVSSVNHQNVDEANEVKEKRPIDWFNCFSHDKCIWSTRLDR